MVAGVAVVLAAAGVIAALWLVDSARTPGAATGAATATAPPSREEPTAVLALTTNMYARPTRTAELVAIIPEGRVARVTGRTDDSEWLRVNYPPASGLEGWVPKASAEVASLPPLAGVPAVAAGAAVAAAGGEVSDGGEQDALPDLTVSSAEVQPNGTLVVRITNVGRGLFQGRVDLQVTGAEGELLGVLDADLTQSPLGAGRSASVNTGVLIRATGLVVIEVDHLNRVAEPDEFNNTRRVLLVGVGG